MPLVPTRALRFSMLPTAWKPPRTTGQRKTVRKQRSYEVSTATFRRERRNGKPYDPVGTVNIARWQSGSEQRLTGSDRRVPCWVAPIRSQPDAFKAIDL